MKKNSFIKLDKFLLFKLPKLMTIVILNVFLRHFFDVN